MLGVVFVIVLVVTSVIFAAFLRAQRLEYPDVEEEQRRAEDSSEDPEPIPMPASGLLIIAFVVMLLTAILVGWWWGLRFSRILLAVVLTLIVGGIASVLGGGTIDKWFLSRSAEDDGSQ